MISGKMNEVSPDRIRRDLFHICKNPLPYRKANYTRPGQDKDTLAETDDYIMGQYANLECEVTSTQHQVQAFRCDESKPIHHWYSSPQPEDPWFTVSNVEVVFPGSKKPEEIIQLVSHKDSMSWIDSPGAHDNASGTVVNLEIGRILASCRLNRTVRILFCNEEHKPWTSKSAAQAASARGDRIIAVLNVDSLDGKPDAEMEAGILTHVVTHSTDEGERLAEFIAETAMRYQLRLDVDVVYKEHVNDDDGMFIEAGYRNTVMNVGSFPYTDSEYHLVGDVPERVNIENLEISAQLILAAVLELDGNGMPE